MPQKTNSSWASDIAGRLKARDSVSEDERNALYNFLLRDPLALSRKTRGALRTVPVARNHRGEWVAPEHLKVLRGRSAQILEPVLHFPAAELAKVRNIEKMWRFKRTIEAEDLIAYASLVVANPQLSDDFEETLDRHRSLLKAKLVRDLAGVPFLRCTLGRTAAPAEASLRTLLTEACLGSAGLFPEGNR
jgi:hypothetical protein